ncbi:hypothetical protein BES34_003880 [Leptospira inadai serovar Lyme]|uniref:Uncharacterized protein n=1 Tax=Leptospira inadai serovar Lyme TaxID=293084 RepID=A0ABX4YLK7_9LEPT|nr:hypothetical protein BES34_003880 [Leptospira inadai serovar Lyme]
MGGGRSEAAELPYFTKIARTQAFFILKFVVELPQNFRTENSCNISNFLNVAPRSVFSKLFSNYFLKFG